MSYLVLARKYRPQTFDDVVRQEHVTRTLTNAISSGRVAHAILFSGPRGTGKTTVARVLAKAMNCETGPAQTPCNKCRSCKEITKGSAVDVFEIDGASNNGVDHIRDLRENIKYMPAHSRYKIYIIDEVHMLSTPAFNALLKTLEEPPAHVMFLFATTEPHKIPITILSRCQRYDLRRIDLDAITQHMASLCQREGVEIAPESLGLIAQESGGSMRDALSLLDQVMSCAEGGISHQQVLDILGVVDRKILWDMARAILNKDVSAVLTLLDDVYDHGHNIKELYGALTGYFRDLVVIKMGPQAAHLVDVPSHEIQRMAELIKKFSDLYLNQVLDVLFREESNIRFSSHPKLAMEMAFIRAFQIQPALPIETLIHKLDDLSRGIIPDLPEIQQRPPAIQQPPNLKLVRPEIQTPAPPMPENSSAPQLPAIVYDSSDSLEQTWAKLTELAGRELPALGSYLNKCSLQALTETCIQIKVGGNGFELGRIKKKESQIKKICDVFLGRSLKLDIQSDEKAEKTNKQKVQQKSLAQQEALNHPMVIAALEIFRGRVEKVSIF